MYVLTRCGDGDEKRAVKAVECCERVDVTEQWLKSDQNGKFWRQGNDLLYTFGTSESAGEAIITIKYGKSSRLRANVCSGTSAG